jgi:probable non-F420 flavinoid oxidoreductase
MTAVGFHASHEQLHPSDLLRAVQAAEAAGFDGAMCSDHFAPWSPRQGQSAFTWSWLGAALATTSDMSFGTVSAPGQRYHPAILAQAMATLAAMHPGRLWVALGSGENVNEHITGDPWPSKPERDARLRECVAIIRALLDGDEVTHHGHVTVDAARLWTRPDVAPLLIGPAITPQTAKAHADWADGLATTNQPPEALQRVVDGYRNSGGRGEITVQVHVSWAPSLQEAEKVALEQWGTNTFPPPTCWDLPSPAAFEAASADVGIDAVRGAVHVTDSLDELTEYLGGLVDLGADRLYLHHVSSDLRVQEEFIDACAQHVLPALRSPR